MREVAVGVVAQAEEEEAANLPRDAAAVSRRGRGDVAAMPRGAHRHALGSGLVRKGTRAAVALAVQEALADGDLGREKGGHHGVVVGGQEHAG